MNDQQLRAYLAACTPAQQAYIRKLMHDPAGRDTDQIMAADTHTSAETKAAAWDYFGDPATNPYRAKA